MIAIGIKNLTSNRLYVKETQYTVLPNQTFFVGEYDYFDLARAQSLKDLINAGSAVIIRDGVLLSAAASIIYLTTPATGGSGESNTASNVTSGGGIGLFKQKTGVDLEFKSLIAGTNITLTAGANDITIDAAGGGTGDFSVTLDSSLSTVTRTVVAGVTTFSVTHSLNTEDIQAEVYRLSDKETIGWTIVRTSVNVIECSRAGSVADNLFRVVILKSGSSGGGGGGGGIALTDLSVTAEGAAAGDGNLAYNNTNGEFTYSPPLLNGLSATGTTNFGANKIEYANNYATLGDLPSASTYHGMFAHVHAEGAAYYSHAGNWVKLADASSVGHEPYITEQKIWSHQVLSQPQGSLNNAINMATDNIKASPIMFEQDVNLNKIGVYSNSTQSGNNGYVGVYELISKSTQGGIDYYQFDLLQTFTPTFVFNAIGDQEITLSPAYKMLAGKVYVIVLLMEQVGSTTQQVVGRQRVPYNRFLGLDYRILQSTTTQAYNPFTNNLPTSMPSSLYMFPNNNQNTSNDFINIKIQNA